MPRTPPASIALPFLVAALGIALFSAMDAVMKGVTLAIGAYNAMFWRNVAGSVIAGSVYSIRRDPLPTRKGMGLHIRRGVIGAFMGTTFFYGIARIPLAEGIALSFIAPLITLYLAAILLGEKVGRNAIFASVLGLIGVCVMLAGRLGGGDLTRDTCMGIGSIFISAILYAYSLILQRQQAQEATPIEVAFFQSLVAGLCMALLAPFWAVFPSAEQWPGLIGSALLAITSLGLLAWAYARAEAQVLVSVEYTAFIWASILGWLLFKEEVTITTLFGTALIVTGCIIAARQSPQHVEVTAT
jgi:S-adenosylmethionine uptake transporter